MRAENFIIKYLDEVKLMQLATATNNKPWVVSVYFAMDNLHNIYWVSTKSRRHSQDITANPHVAMTAHQPYKVGEPGRAVYAEGTAREVPAEQVEALFQAYAERYNRHADLPKLLDKSTPPALYQFTPESFVLFDELNFPDQPRQEWTPQAAPTDSQ